jgi:spore germination protein KC
MTLTNFAKRIPHFCCLLLVILTLTGCWDNKDINHRVLPVALGIAKVEKEYKVVLNIPEPEGGKIKSKIVFAQDETIAKAVDTISRDMESSVDLLHVKLILIEREAAEDGVKDIMEGFMRSRDVSPKAMVAICDEDIHEFFLKIKDSVGPGGATTYNFFEKNAGWNPDIALTRVWEVYRGINSSTRDIAIPMIRSGNSTPLEHVGSAIIKKGKMVDQITTNETLLYNIFKGESSHGEIEVMDHATVMIVSNTIKHQSQFSKQRPIMKSWINIKVVILETKGNPSAGVIRKELDQLLTERFSHLFAKLRDSKADVLGFGQFFRAHIPKKELKNWDNDYYPNMKMDIEFNIDIQNEGYLRTT